MGAQLLLWFSVVASSKEPPDTVEWITAFCATALAVVALDRRHRAPLAALGVSPRIGESTAVALLGPTGGRLVALGRMRSTTSRSRRAQILRLLSDATHGNCHLLLALRLTIQRFTAFAEVIERCGDRIVLGYRPVEAVCLQPVGARQVTDG